MDIGAVSLWPSNSTFSGNLFFFGSNPGTHWVLWRKPPYFFFMLLKSGDKHHLLHFETLSNPSVTVHGSEIQKKNSVFWFLEPGLKPSGFPCEIFCYQAQQVSPHFIGGGLDGSPDRSSTSTSHRMGKSHTFDVHQLCFVGTLNKNVSKLNLDFLMPISFRLLFLLALCYDLLRCFANSNFCRGFSNADCYVKPPFFQCRGVIPIWAQECSKFCSKISSWIPSEWNSIGVDIQFGGCHYIAPNDEEMLFRIFLAFLTSLLFPPPRWF